MNELTGQEMRVTAEPDGPASLTAADVRDIIRLAEAFNREEAEKVRNLEGSRIYTIRRLVPVPEQTDAEAALESRITALTKPALLELMALVWIGREICIGRERDASGWRAHLANAREVHDEGSVAYIADKSPELPEYLASGMTLIPLPG
jgi:hypothetical protein